MPNIQISQLPAAQPLDGTELVPIVQEGVTVRTTTQAIAASPTLTQTFITVNQEPTLTNSRALSANNGVTLVDGGALSTLSVQLTGTALSLQNASDGLLYKVTGNIVPRTLVSGSSGISIANGNGASGNPSVSLSGRVLDLQTLGGSSGFLALTAGSVTSATFQGTANEIDVFNGGGPANPVISISANPVLPGTGGVVVPSGTTAERPALPTVGTIRYNTDVGNLEAYDAVSGWSSLPAGAVTLINTGTGLTGGPITTTGTISIANTGVSAASYGAADKTLTATVNAQGQLTALSDTPIAITNTQVSGLGTMSTQNASSVSITGGSITGTNVTLTQAATFNNSGLGDISGTIFNGSASHTISYNTIGAPSVTGTNASGTWNISITGNAATATSSTSVANSVTFNSSGGASPNSTFNGAAPLTVDYSTVGAPKADGTGASGTWGINISGNAATATSATTAGSATTATTATNLAGGAAGSIPYQTAAGATTFLSASSGVLVGGTTPSYSTAPSLTGTNFSSIPNAALQNSSLTIGTTAISLGASSTTLAGLTSVTLTQNPSTALEAATKQYVDGLVSSGITYHTPVKYEVPSSTGNLNAIYNQPGGPGVGVGATLTNNGTLVAFAPDGPTASPGDRILIYNQNNAFENGVYTVTTVGSGLVPWVLTRATDADTYALKNPNGLGEGDAFFITSGNTGAGETYVLNTQGTIIFGTTALTFVQVSSSQVYSAGTGLTLTGTQFSLTSPVVTGLGGTGLTSYTTGDMVYYASGTALSKLAIGSSTYVMTSSGSAPQWSDPATITVGSATSATSATTATNVAGGAANQIVFQTGASTTSFVTAPTIASTFLQWNGSAFTWAAGNAGTVTSVDVSGGTTGLTTSGGPITSNGTITLAGTLVAANGGTGQSSYMTGDLLYASASTSLSKLAIGSSTYILTSSGTSPQWSDPATVSVNSATTATNVAGGTAGALVYNTGSGATTFLSLGTSTYILTAGASAPQYTDPSSITVGTATTATNATNVATTATGTNSNFFIPFVPLSTTSNQALGVDAGLSYNPSTNAITAGISGGTF